MMVEENCGKNMWQLVVQIEKCFSKFLTLLTAHSDTLKYYNCISFVQFFFWKNVFLLESMWFSFGKSIKWGCYKLLNVCTSWFYKFNGIQFDLILKDFICHFLPLKVFGMIHSFYCICFICQFLKTCIVWLLSIQL